MKLEIRTKEKITVVDLDVLAARYAGFLKLKNGQNRSECPKGLMSDKTVPCEVEICVTE